MAVRLIAQTAIVYYQYTGRTLNEVGQDVVTYAAPVTVLGSYQPVQRAMYEQLGLDFTKNYYNFYVPSDFLDVSRDVSGDQITYNGRRFQCQSNTEWFSIDGWQAVLTVDIGAA